MSAQLETFAGRDGVIAPMRKEHLQSVIAIENAIYTFPWTLRNFSDSLDAGYGGWTLNLRQGSRDACELAGYFVLMVAADEAHLLNLSVAAPHQCQGHGRRLLGHAAALSRSDGAHSMLLEVRVSNHRAIEMYRRFGFSAIGLRKGYYPSSAGDRNSREDAEVMRLEL